jgi:hypothetical protein
MCTNMSKRELERMRACERDHYLEENAHARAHTHDAHDAHTHTHLFEDKRVHPALVRSVCVREDLDARDSKRPHVAQLAELPRRQSLGCCPPNGHLASLRHVLYAGAWRW